MHLTNQQAREYAQRYGVSVRTIRRYQSEGLDLDNVVEVRSTMRAKKSRW
jgi:hypothetical protein